MPQPDLEAHRTAATRRTKPVVARELAGGAVLGSLVWLAAVALGLQGVFHLSDMGGLGPAALLGGLIGLTRLRPLLWLAGGALAAIFAIVAFTPLIVQPAQALIRSDPIPSPPLTLDAVVVLSSRVSTDGMLSPVGADRLLSGIRLAKAVGAKILVTTRVRSTTAVEVHSDTDQKRLVDLTGPGLLLLVLPDVFSTRDEALRVRDLARQRRWSRVAVVTSPAHTRRACGTFEKAGLRVTCVPADSRDVAFKTLTSPVDRVDAFKLWIYEIAGTINYRLKGWLP